MMIKILVTGGAGFIGSAVCRHLASDANYSVVNADKLTYAGNLNSLLGLDQNPRYKFYEADICNEANMLSIMQEEGVDAIMNLAAESHVDRSIDGPLAFVHTNVLGTCSLLNAALTFWRALSDTRKTSFRFHHISTDEVFGDLPLDSGFFTEETPYAPSSPYSASKASSDHLVRAYFHTYGLPTVISNCSNNYGPFHFPEKLIPLVILNALHELPLPVYGNGANVRDWLYVDDHVRALVAVLTQGTAGQSYNIGGNSERTNLQVVQSICDALDRKSPRSAGGSYRELIKFVSDRPGHDRRYAIDAAKIRRDLGWVPQETFETGLDKTIDWYLANEWWWRPIREKTYKGERLGAGAK